MNNNKERSMYVQMKYLQNPFYKACVCIKLSLKWMRNTEFYGILAILILGLAAIILPIALSYLTATIIISNSGKILTIKTPITYKSEIRGVFFHESIYGVSHDWNVIAQTLANYGINAVFVNDQNGNGYRPYSEIRAAINAFHAKGIEYHSVMSVLLEWTNPGTEAITSDGSIYWEYAHCPIKAHNLILNEIRNYLETFPDVDGIMLDYIRYASDDMCYCQYCRAAFQEWLGEGTITNWTQFYPDQARWEEYAEWRTLPVTQLVKDIHDTAKSINPNVVISEAAWTLFSDSAIYWRKWLGQDTAKWIAEGYVDFVAPMMYNKDIYGSSGETLESEINANLKYWMGGQPEGKIPLVAFLRVDHDDEDLTPEQFVAQINYVRSRGLDGWIIWRYGGPGSGEPNPDIRNYLSAIDLPDTFSIRNIQVLVNNETSATINWFTDLPATSKIEYSTNSLFNASWKTQNGFHYWNITRIQPTVVADNTNVTEHSLTLAGVMPGTLYYFRIQSQGASGIATSKVMIFTTSG